MKNAEPLMKLCIFYLRELVENNLRKKSIKLSQGHYQNNQKEGRRIRGFKDLVVIKRYSMLIFVET
jgi:hypothetical protein